MTLQRLVYVLLPLLVVGLYAQLFSLHEEKKSVKEARLMPAMPTEVFQVVGHTYAKQILADLLFIKVAVFYGGNAKVEDSVDAMASHFITMNKLHPEMIDFYYRTEAALADKGDAYVRITNRILSVGREHLPDDVYLPYVEGFNHFYYLDEPLKAAELLKLAATYDEKYQWLGHLASVLVARGGDVQTGLIWLKGMYNSLEDGPEKDRYAQDIQDYEKAKLIDLAIQDYYRDKGEYPSDLELLAPKYLTSLPKISEHFKLEYEPPILRLKGSKEHKKGVI